VHAAFVAVHGHALHAIVTPVPTSVFCGSSAGQLTSPARIAHVRNPAMVALHKHADPRAAQTRTAVVATAAGAGVASAVHVGAPEGAGGTSWMVGASDEEIGVHAPLFPARESPSVPQVPPAVPLNFVLNVPLVQPGSFATLHAPHVHASEPGAGFATRSSAFASPPHALARSVANATTSQPGGVPGHSHDVVPPDALPEELPPLDDALGDPDDALLGASPASP
jgi:hypothetical protein